MSLSQCCFQMFWFWIKNFEKKNFIFDQLMNARSDSGISQVMIEKVDLNSIEKYGIGELDEQKINTFEIISLKGLIEK